MKKRSLGLVVIIALMAGLFLVAAVYAGTKPPVEMEITAPYKHTKSPVVFHHQKHSKEYKLACAECHHDDKGKPLTNLKEGDDVKKCIDCHKKPGELKGKKAAGLSKKEKLEYHANALHENCIGCHKEYNKKNKTKKAPQKCTDCHPKKK
jgi:Class III cytochrome C family